MLKYLFAQKPYRLILVTVKLVHCSQNKYTKNDEYFSECVHQKRRRSGAKLRIFDECNQENRQVIWYTYLRNDALAYK